MLPSPEPLPFLRPLCGGDPPWDNPRRGGGAPERSRRWGAPTTVVWLEQAVAGLLGGEVGCPDPPQDRETPGGSRAGRALEILHGAIARWVKFHSLFRLPHSPDWEGHRRHARLGIDVAREALAEAGEWSPATARVSLGRIPLPSTSPLRRGGPPPWYRDWVPTAVAEARWLWGSRHLDVRVVEIAVFVLLAQVVTRRALREGPPAKEGLSEGRYRSADLLAAGLVFPAGLHHPELSRGALAPVLHSLLTILEGMRGRGGGGDGDVYLSNTLPVACSDLLAVVAGGDRRPDTRGYAVEEGTRLLLLAAAAGVFQARSGSLHPRTSFRCRGRGGLARQVAVMAWSLRCRTNQWRFKEEEARRLIELLRKFSMQFRIVTKRNPSPALSGEMAHAAAQVMAYGRALVWRATVENVRSRPPRQLAQFNKDLKQWCNAAGTPLPPGDPQPERDAPLIAQALMQARVEGSSLKEAVTWWGRTVTKVLHDYRTQVLAREGGLRNVERTVRALRRASRVRKGRRSGRSRSEGRWEQLRESWGLP